MSSSSQGIKEGKLEVHLVYQQRVLSGARSKSTTIFSGLVHKMHIWVHGVIGNTLPLQGKIVGSSPTGIHCIWLYGIGHLPKLSVTTLVMFPHVAIGA